MLKLVAILAVISMSIRSHNFCRIRVFWLWHRHMTVVRLILRRHQLTLRAWSTTTIASLGRTTLRTSSSHRHISKLVHVESALPSTIGGLQTKIGQALAVLRPMSRQFRGVKSVNICKASSLELTLTPYMEQMTLVAWQALPSKIHLHQSPRKSRLNSFTRCWTVSWQLCSSTCMTMAVMCWIMSAKMTAID